MSMIDDRRGNDVVTSGQTSFAEAEGQRQLAKEASKEWRASGGQETAMQMRKSWTEKNDPELAEFRGKQDGQQR